MEMTNELPELISEQAAEHKINIEEKKSILFLHVREEPTEGRIIPASPFTTERIHSSDSIEKSTRLNFHYI